MENVTEMCVKKNFKQLFQTKLCILKELDNNILELFDDKNFDAINKIKSSSQELGEINELLLKIESLISKNYITITQPVGIYLLKVNNRNTSTSC